MKFNPIHDMKCGRHSGIPLCCIFWFILVWRPLFRFRRLRKWYIFKVVLDWDYVACPVCWIFKRNKGTKLKSCKCMYRAPDCKTKEDVKTLRRIEKL